MALLLMLFGMMPSFAGANGWINSQPLSLTDLRGKVVLVEFWTYTCINWRRTLPYVSAWASKYKDAGLVVIGVSTPEFSFEKDPVNVRWAVKDMQINFPIAIDNDYSVWNSFSNEYWPALYFIDAKGKIRHSHFGEGDYEQSEKVIQQLLAEGGVKNVPGGISPVTPTGFSLAADGRTLESGETYVGYARAQNFSSVMVRDKDHTYVNPSRLSLNQWALSGDWTVSEEAATLVKKDGRVIFRFHARDVNLIMGAPRSIRYRVTIDGKAPGDAHGVDVDAGGNGVVNQRRMYQLVRQPGPISDRDITIEFLDPEVQVFDFTFG